jgi:hypothetical protein
MEIACFTLGGFASQGEFPVKIVNLQSGNE